MVWGTGGTKRAIACLRFLHSPEGRISLSRSENITCRRHISHAAGVFHCDVACNITRGAPSPLVVWGTRGTRQQIPASFTRPKGEFHSCEARISRAVGTFHRPIGKANGIFHYAKGVDEVRFRRGQVLQRDTVPGRVAESGTDLRRLHFASEQTRLSTPQRGMRSPVREEPLHSVKGVVPCLGRKPGGTAGLSPVPVFRIGVSVRGAGVSFFPNHGR